MDINPSLRYLFVAEFINGERLTQTLEDRSEIDPSKNAFYDVMQRSKQVALARFHLTDGHQWYSVDLRDGSFEINGIPFETFDPHNNPYGRITPPLRLIYFVSDDSRAVNKLVKVTNPNDTNKVMDYHYSAKRFLLGWQFTDGGKNYQQTIAIR